MLDNALARMLKETANRRRFLQSAGLSAAGLATAMTGSVLAARPARAGGAGTLYTDANIFNFALNFEFLGAEYYLAALGTSLPSSLTGTSTNQVIKAATTTVPFQNTAIAYFAEQLAVDEYAHVTVIQEALKAEKATPIVEPQIDLLNSWNSLAVAAGLITAGESFNPFESENNFLIGAYILEDTCVTALCGAASLLTNPLNLTYAASILGVEGYQIGAIRQRLSAIGAGAATNAISALRSTLANAIINVGTDDFGTDLSATGGNPFNFTNVDINGQAFRRTPGQILNIAYGGAGSLHGGFFPTGVAGNINSTADNP